MNRYLCMNRNSNYQKEIERILVSRKKDILDFFNVTDEGQFNFSIYIYDTIDALVAGMKSRGFDKMPDYMCACYKDEDKSLNFLNQRIILMKMNGVRKSMKGLFFMKKSMQFKILFMVLNQNG